MKLGNWTKLITISILFTCSYLWAQPRQLDIKRERSKFLELQMTEAQQERNISDTYNNMSVLGWLVDMVKKDRKLIQEQNTAKGRLDFKKNFRFVKFTPRNTYVRFVSASETFLFSQFGSVKVVQDLIAKEVTKAKNVGVKTKDIVIPKKEGIELTQFTFIYGYKKNSNKRIAIGSKRKSLMLFFTPKAPTATNSSKWELALLVTKVVKDNFREGVRNVEMIIDTSPKDAPMDDVIILHQYNQKPVRVIVLGSMSNTAVSPHRLKFKKKLYARLMDHFFRLYRLVANYATKDGNKYNNTVIESIKSELDY